MHFNASLRLGLRRWIAVIPLVWLSLMAVRAYGQQTATPAEEVQAAQAALPATESVTLESIESALQEVDAATELDDAAKTKLNETLNQAKTELGTAALQLSDAAKLKSSIDSAADDIEAVTKQKSPLQGYDFASTASRKLNELSADRSSLEQQLADAKKALTTAQAEPQRRVERSAAIPNEISTANELLTKTREEIKAIRSGSSASLEVRAQLLLLEAIGQAQEASIKKLENERDAYEAQGELPRLQIDLATAQVKQLEQDIMQLVDIVTQRRRTDAAEQKATAELALQRAPPLLKPFAQENVDLANRRLELANAIRDAASLRDRTDKQLARWQDDFERMKKRSSALDTDSVGTTLVEKRSSLPSVLLLKRTISDGERALSSYQQELYELEDRRADLSDLNTAIERAVEESRETGVSISQPAEAELRELFTAESQILDSLLKDSNRNYTLRISTRESQLSLIGVIEQYSEFIDRILFWAPSAPPLQPAHIVDSGRAIGWLVNRESATAMFAQVVRRLQRRPLSLLFLSTAVILLLVFRARLREELEHCGGLAAKISCRTIAPTIRATVSTLLLAIPGPAVLWILGRALSDATSEPVRATALALGIAAWWWFTFDTIRQLWRPKGLAEAHFGWPTEYWRATSGSLRLLVTAGTPLMFLGSVFQYHGDPAFRASIGRICLIALLLLIAWSGWMIFRDRQDDRQENQKPNWKTWSRLAVFVPVALAIASAIGFHYSAYELTLDCLLTFLLMIGALVLRALLFRWVRVTRRSIRWQQLVEARRQRAEGGQHSDSSDIDALVMKEEETDLVAMDYQTRRLIDLVIGTTVVLSLAAIWLEIFPALTPLLEAPINPFYVPTELTRPVTIGSLLIALAITALTVMGWRNVPGLIDVLLLGRLGIESSIRYALTTLSQYAIGIAGVILACNALGMTWGNVQWLVAAMSVGLGFGLQEIVANFVCGVLLLFERPIRVGDIVTLGDTTGVVVRIRSRATTVRNWDRQEVVIPNKELITGRITNWTLTDNLNRIVLQVGVAYGTDTERVRNLLRQLLADNPSILDDPRPLVTFEQFGDSTLNFIVRAYLQNMDDRMETIHQLHTMIHQRFNDEGIEISFPQQDLHLRSVDPSIRLTEAIADDWGSPPDQSDE